ncbi:hypothetical protein [Alicyclobacillus sp. ALC3]|uniref:hypothetical protein n=1 Tax=Alicyclobacillus sp. ALC3 TaxID=2796143 RepID=UPI0023782648|nr:hypothetical protein [Alicyclobacillus sp. ALC3]WDL96110.1 hypothetical protein JC200_17470 [Alicyclobacillus sp. ALC3]
MKLCKKWTSVGIAFILAGILAGCGQAVGGNRGRTTSASNDTAYKVTNSATTDVTSAVNNTSVGGNSVAVEKPAASNTTPQPIAAGSENFSDIKLVAPKNVTVNGVAFNPAPTINGILEPVVLTTQFTIVTQPIRMDMSGLILNNPSANIGGGVAYYQYNNVIYKTSANYPGNYPVEGSLTISRNSKVIFICTVGTPVPPAKVSLLYNDVNLGIYSATTMGSYSLN